MSMKSKIEGMMDKLAAWYIHYIDLPPELVGGITFLAAILVFICMVIL